MSISWLNGLYGSGKRTKKQQCEAEKQSKKWELWWEKVNNMKLESTKRQVEREVDE